MIVAGAVLGVVNTVLTEAVMRIAPVERPIASSAYSFVRFAGGAVAPWLAGKLAEWVAPDTPFFVGAAAVGVALIVLIAGRALLRRRPGRGRGRGLRAGCSAHPCSSPSTAPRAASTVTAAAAKLATERGAAVEVLHVHRDRRDRGRRRRSREPRRWRRRCSRSGSSSCARRACPPAARSCTRSATATTPRQAVLDRVDEIGAQLVVVGREGRVSARATVPVMVVGD